ASTHGSVNKRQDFLGGLIFHSYHCLMFGLKVLIPQPRKKISHLTESLIDPACLIPSPSKEAVHAQTSAQAHQDQYQDKDGNDGNRDFSQFHPQAVMNFMK